jgi:hypothetical protein
MSATADRLRLFACAVLARGGAVVDWPEQAASGEALLTGALAQRLGCGDLVRLASGSAEGDVRLDLAGDAIEQLQALSLEGGWITAARLADRPAKKLDAAALVDSTVDIANARVRLATAAPAKVEYHCWHVAVQITGEEPWEDLVQVSINASTKRAVTLARDERSELLPWQPLGEAPDTRTAAVEAAVRSTEERARAFVGRLALRRERDRKRLRDYYHALLAPARRGRPAPAASLEEIDGRRRAVEQELKRKLDEVDERSQLRLTIQPIALQRLELPAWNLDITIQRRTEIRTMRACWNHLTGGFEPLACARCGQLGKTFLARDADAALICPRCTAL